MNNFLKLFEKFQEKKKGWILIPTICATNLNYLWQLWPFISAAVATARQVSNCKNMLWQMQTEMLTENMPSQKS